MGCGPSLVATMWVALKVEQRRKRRIEAGQAVTGTMALDQGLFRGVTYPNTATWDIDDELRTMFGDEQKMKAMALWMQRDLTIDVFLCFVELVHFKQMVIVMVQERNPRFQEQLITRQRHNFYENCPRASLV